MTEVLKTRYAIEGSEFTIKYLYQTGQGSMRKAHAHPTYEIYYVLDGGRVYFINNTVYTVQKGDMILVNPNDIHRTTSSDAPKCERILVNFKESFLADELARCPISLLKQFGVPLIRLPVDKQAIVEELLQKMIRECENKQEAHETYVRALLTELLIQMHRNAVNANVKPTSSTHPMHQRMTEIATYLNDHFQGKITLQDIADLFYISPSYLSRTFKKITGFHFKEYLLIIRLREAKRLLRESRDAISQIAEKTGFEHAAHFTIVFKKGTGITPANYRKIYR